MPPSREEEDAAAAAAAHTGCGEAPGWDPCEAAGEGEGFEAAWAEEVVALHAIHESAFAASGPLAARLVLQLPPGCAVATRPDAPLRLEALRLRAAEGGGECEEAEGAAGRYRYPAGPPLLALSCAGLGAGALRRLTRVVAEVRAGPLLRCLLCVVWVFAIWLFAASSVSLSPCHFTRSWLPAFTRDWVLA